MLRKSLLSMAHHRGVIFDVLPPSTQEPVVYPDKDIAVFSKAFLPRVQVREGTDVHKAT